VSGAGTGGQAGAAGMSTRLAAICYGNSRSFGASIFSSMNRDPQCQSCNRLCEFECFVESARDSLLPGMKLDEVRTTGPLGLGTL
jgi:hypothetical protein